MFKRRVKTVQEVLLGTLRAQGLETPLLQRRVINAWQDVGGPIAQRYTRETYIRDTTLYIHLTSPALRADLNMQRRELVRRLNAHVGATVITDIKFC